MTLRTKTITAHVITVDADLVQSAMDYLVMSKAGSVAFQVVNGRCVNIDTETVRVALPSPPPEIESRLDDAMRTLTVHRLEKQVTTESILRLLTKGEQTAMEISDTFGLVRNGPGRAKVTRLLGILRNQGRIDVRIESGVYHYAISKTQKAVAKADKATMRRRITKDAITRILRERGELCSRLISDALDLPRGDNIRSLVSSILANMVRDRELEKHGDKPGAAVYKLAEAA